MLNLVTGGAGFLGSHLVNALVDDGERVIIADNLATGHVRNLEHALSSGRATFVFVDVATSTEKLSEVIASATPSPLDRIYHLASPASSSAYATEPWAALEANGVATMSLIDLAVEHRAGFLFASAASVYSSEPIDLITAHGAHREAKRFGEAAVAAAVKTRGLDGRVARIFNCYGPGMDEADGRLVSMFIEALLEGKPFPIHGTGEQTRPFTYITDAVELLRKIMEHQPATFSPIDVSSDDERSVAEVARTLASIAGVDFAAVHLPARPLDVQSRLPDLAPARSLGWEPATPLEGGLSATYRWFREARLVYA